MPTRSRAVPLLAAVALAAAAAPAAAQRTTDPPADPTDGPDPGIVNGSAQRALDAARARWSASGTRSYRMRIGLRCFCPPPRGGSPTVRVRAGRSVGKVPSTVRPYATVPRQFARVQEAIDARVAQLTVAYATGTGRPTSFYVDRDRRIADEELGVDADRFRRER